MTYIEQSSLRSHVVVTADYGCYEDAYSSGSSQTSSYTLAHAAVEQRHRETGEGNHLCAILHMEFI